MRYSFILILFFSCITQLSVAQKEPAKVVAGIPVNYKEDSVGSYTLPALLLTNNGKKVKTADDWMNKRRPELIQLYEENQFGKIPGRPVALHFKTFEKGTVIMNGKVVRKQVTVYFTADTLHKMELLTYLPANSAKPVPLLLYISFSSNSNMFRDTGIKLNDTWTREGKRLPATRADSDKIDIVPFIDAGIGVATVYYGDIEPDFKDGIKYGIRQTYFKNGQTQPAPNEWGAIAAWAWGLSRAMDYFETDAQVDAKRIALFGVSRLGKTVLCAGAYDTRFAMVIANCSGEGGAAISRRNYGETIAHLSHPTRYAYQFCSNYGNYANSVDQFPVDAHFLISLIAPRPLLLQTGNTDYWSDPKGEFEAAVAATPVYSLFGKKGLANNKMPAAGQPLLHTLGYSMHSGGHGTVPADWPIALEFMKKYLLQ